MSSNHLLSTALQNKTIIVQRPTIDVCFWDFQNHDQNGDKQLDYSFSISMRESWLGLPPSSIISRDRKSS